MALRYLLILALVPLVLGAPSKIIQKTKVSVYYESLSPKSQNFFTKQLYPLWLELKDYIAVDLYLYGRTTETVDIENGFNFECIHGPEECVGNNMMMCAKMIIPTVEQYMGFSNCIMEKFEGAAKGQACADEFNTEYNVIANCANSFTGQFLLHQTGLKQKQLAQSVESAPWILINDVFTEDQMMAARENLRQVVCAANEAIPAEYCA